MKIVYLIEELGGGGKERRLVELLKGLSIDSNYQIHLVLTKSIISYPEVELLPITIHRIQGFSNFALIRHYYLVLKKIQPDIVHTWSFKASFYASILKSLIKYKLVSGFITNTFGQSKLHQILSYLLIFRFSDKVLSNSNLGIQAYKVPDKKACVIYNGFDSKRLSSDINKSSLTKIGVNTIFTVIMVANVTPKKDYETFIKAALEVTKKNKDVSFVSIGKISDQYFKMVSPFIDNKHDKIKFIGFNNNAVQLIQESDIGLLCSEREGLSNSIMEYMAAGLPVVTTDIKGASNELLTNGVNGFLCNKKEVPIKLELLLNNDFLRDNMGMCNVKRVKSKFSIEKMISNHKIIYIDLFSN